MKIQITQAVRRAELLFRDHPAILDGDRRLNWAEFASRVKRLAAGLVSLGIGDDDKVAILSLNGFRYLEAIYGTLWAGGVTVPLNVRLAVPELVYQIDEAEVRVLIVDDTFAMMLPAMREKLASMPTVLHAADGQAPEGTISYDALIEKSDHAPDAGRCGGDVAGIFYTGGTTGRAKGVMLTHESIMANTLNSRLSHGGGPNDIYLHSAPMFHLADLSATFGITLVGATHAFIPYFEPAAMMAAIAKYKVTQGLMIPTMLNMVLNHPEFDSFDLSSLRLVGYGASPIPEALLRKALKTLPCEFLQGYGMTELSPLCSYLPAEDHVTEGTEAQLKRLRSAGIPIFTAEVAVMDENDHEVPRGTVGEICACGPMVMKGYWKQPEATAEALRNGWMHTGDMGYMDEDGYIYLVDRSKDMIVTGGENVYSTEVEAALYEHPAVLEAAVIGIPDAQWGEAVHAVVHLKEDKHASDEELIHHCHARIANYKCPKSVSFHEAELPKSGAGKILKRDLRTPFWEGHERQIH